MSRTPRVVGPDLVAALGKAGFGVLRIIAVTTFCATRMVEARSSPVHSGETIGPGLLHKILRDCHLSVDELRKLL